MKDVKQCSISSVAFILEIDAYETLYSYIESIRSRYSNDEDGDEIIADIEARIAELILAVHTADRVVSKPLINNIINQLGSVDDICADATGEESHRESSEEPRQKTRRRLYRNVDDAPIGGVCSGVAMYLGCDPVVIRILALILAFIGGVTIWIYLILWIIMPAAITARQKLEMRGEPITVNSIKDFYTSLADDEAGRSTSIISRIISVLGHILMVIFKVIMFVVLTILILTLIASAIGLFAVIASWGGIGSWLDLTVPVMALVSAIMLIGLGIYVSLQLINSQKVKSSVIVTTLIVWLLLSLISSVAIAWSGKGVSETIRELRQTFTSSTHNYQGTTTSAQGGNQTATEHTSTKGKKMQTLNQLEEIYYESVSSEEEE